MPSIQINVIRQGSTSRSRSTGRRRSRSPRQRSRSVGRRRRERSTTRRSPSRRRRRHRRNDQPPRDWVGMQEPPRIWRGPSLMPSAGRVEERRQSESFLTSVSGFAFDFCWVPTWLGKWSDREVFCFCCCFCFIQKECQFLPAYKMFLLILRSTCIRHLYLNCHQVQEAVLEYSKVVLH